MSNTTPKILTYKSKSEMGKSEKEVMTEAKAGVTGLLAKDQRQGM